jgi:hypothetical protein
MMAAQKPVKKIPVSVIPKRDLQARLCMDFTITGKNILCVDQLSTKILAIRLPVRGLGGPAHPPPEPFPDFKAQITSGRRWYCKTRTISMAPEYYLDLKLIFCYNKKFKMVYHPSIRKKPPFGMMLKKAHVQGARISCHEVWL